jgi:hypothetical protein
MRIKRKYLLASGLLLVLICAPFAVAAGEGDPLRGGVRNPSADQAQELRRETEIIADVNTYGTRQSNKSDNGGGAIYGCRSGVGGTPQGNEPCIRSRNLAAGRAFEFETGGVLGGVISVPGGDAAKPFTTNATGVADGLNADRVDGRHAQELIDAAVNQAVTQAVNQAVAQVQNAIRFADVDADGSLTADRGVAASSRASVGQYNVTFDQDVAACALTVTVVGETGGPAGDSTGYASVQKLDARTVRVRAWQAIDVDPTDGTPDTDTGNPLEDNDFHIVANC